MTDLTREELLERRECFLGMVDALKDVNPKSPLIDRFLTDAEICNMALKYLDSQWKECLLEDGERLKPGCYELYDTITGPKGHALITPSSGLPVGYLCTVGATHYRGPITPPKETP